MGHTIRIPGYAAEGAPTIPPMQVSIEEYVRVAAHFRLRCVDVATIVRNVAAKARPEYLPAGFTSLAKANMHRAVVVPVPSVGRVSVQFSRVGANAPFETTSNFDFPIELLAASDRDIAVWARERIGATRRNGFHRARVAITDEIARLAGVISRNDASTEKAKAQLEEKERQLANLGTAPAYVAPTRYPKKKRPARA